VRTNAPEGDRARRIEQQQGLTREAALEVVRQTDRERAARVKFLYHVDVDDPLLYDFVINTERMTADEGAHSLQQIVREGRFQSTEVSRTGLADLNVVAQARARFMAHPTLSGRQLFISASGGAVSLSGSVAMQEERLVAEGLVAGIAGVRSVLNEIITEPVGSRGRGY
jgi:hypothetical protein